MMSRYAMDFFFDELDLLKCFSLLRIFFKNQDGGLSISEKFWMLLMKVVECRYKNPGCLGGPKSAAGQFPQSEEKPIWDQLVFLISVALKLLSTPSYITLLLMLTP